MSLLFDFLFDPDSDFDSMGAAIFRIAGGVERRGGAAPQARLQVRSHAFPVGSIADSLLLTTYAAADDGGLGETRPTAVAQSAPQARLEQVLGPPRGALVRQGTM